MKFILFFLTLFSFSFAHAFKQIPNYTSLQKVLHIGDSQTEGYLGQVLHKHFSQNFSLENIQVYGVGGSSPRHWAKPKSKWLCSRKGRDNLKTWQEISKKICVGPEKTPVFTYINKNDLDLVVFQFLGNSMGLDNSHIFRNVELLMSQIKEMQTCVFVTSPPFYIDLREGNRRRLETEGVFIEAIGDRCHIIRGMSKENLDNFAKDRTNYQSDGKHLSLKGAEAFHRILKNDLP